MLATAYRKLRSVVGRYQYRSPANVRCNICGWSGRHFFSDGWHPLTICWKCGSSVRHRLLMATLLSHPELSFGNLVRGKRVLHFAPEPQLRDIFRAAAASYVTANIDRSAERRLDLTALDLPSESFDLIIACDVLEHVGNDKVALSEIRRVLVPGGYAILTVPQKDGLKDTFEDPTVTDHDERTRIFGQADHLRIYGDSFPEILSSAGFKTTAINEASFSETAIRQNVLFPPILSTHPLATNYRKVFFGMKG